jgi:hypothetical protein
MIWIRRDIVNDIAVSLNVGRNGKLDLLQLVGHPGNQDGSG